MKDIIQDPIFWIIVVFAPISVILIVRFNPARRRLLLSKQNPKKISADHCGKGFQVLELDLDSNKVLLRVRNGFNHYLIDFEDLWFNSENIPIELLSKGVLFYVCKKEDSSNLYFQQMIERHDSSFLSFGEPILAN